MDILVNFLYYSVRAGTPLLLGTTGEIITEKSGHLNLGIPGIMYVGAISGVVGSFLYENSCGNDIANMNPFLAVFIPLICAIIGAVLMGLIYSVLTVTLHANQNVTGLAITTATCATFRSIWATAISAHRLSSLSSTKRLSPDRRNAPRQQLFTAPMATRPPHCNMRLWRSSSKARERLRGPWQRLRPT